jgi:hypothetical protein
VEEKTRIKENKNGVSRMGLDEIIDLIGGSEPCYIIVLVALLGLAGRNRLHSIPFHSYVRNGLAILRQTKPRFEPQFPNVTS